MIAGLLSCSGPQTPPSTSGERLAATSSVGAEASAAAPESTSAEAPSASSVTTAPAVASSAPESKISPIDPALPETKDVRALARRGACPETPAACFQRIIVPDTLRPEPTDPAPIYIWEQIIPRRSMLYLPKHAGLDLYGVMLDGEVSVLADDIPGKDKQKRLWRLDALRAPGVGVNIYAKEPTRIVLALVSTGGDPVAKALSGLPYRDVSWKKRPSMIATFEFAHRSPVSWGGGAFHARYGFAADSDSPSASLTLLLASKDASIAENTHDKEWEALVILQGHGDMTIKGTRQKLEPGSVWTVPPGTAHGFRTAGTSPMFAIQFFVGPGPEQRYRQLASP